MEEEEGRNIIKSRPPTQEKARETKGRRRTVEEGGEGGLRGSEGKKERTKKRMGKNRRKTDRGGSREKRVFLNGRTVVERGKREETVDALMMMPRAISGVIITTWKDFFGLES